MDELKGVSRASLKSVAELEEKGPPQQTGEPATDGFLSSPEFLAKLERRRSELDGISPLGGPPAFTSSPATPFDARESGCKDGTLDQVFDGMSYLDELAARIASRTAQREKEHGR